jgi:hypothetical protein
LGPDGDVFVTGVTVGEDFPVTNAFQPNLKGTIDAFVARIRPVIEGTMGLDWDTVPAGDPLTYEVGLDSRLLRSTDSVSATIEFPPCVDTSGFNPEVIRDQVSSEPPFSTLSWNPPTLIVDFGVTIFAPFDTAKIDISGTKAGSGDPSCCATANIIHEADQNGYTASCCVQVGGCSGNALPEQVRGLKATKQPRSAPTDVRLEWQEASPLDTVTTQYVVYRVVSQDKRVIPLANTVTVASGDRRVVRLTPSAPRDNPVHIDRDVIFRFSPKILFYQVRGACSDGREGT